MNHISTNMHPNHKCITDSLCRATWREYMWRQRKITKHISKLAKLLVSIHKRQALEPIIGHPIFYSIPNNNK